MIRSATAILILLLTMAGIVPWARAAGEGYVLQDDTPLVSKPGVGGRVVARVDAGVRLLIVDRDGEWLEVSSPMAGASAGGLWVPAARVGAYRPDSLGDVLGTEATGLRLDVVGTAPLRVRARCRIVRSGPDDFGDVTGEVPLRLDLPGRTADCTVRKLGRGGTIEAALRTADGRIVASARISAQNGAVRVRTDGPWGGAAGIVLPPTIVLLKDVSRISVLSATPVPPLGNPTPPFQQSPVPPP